MRRHTWVGILKFRVSLSLFTSSLAKLLLRYHHHTHVPGPDIGISLPSESGTILAIMIFTSSCALQTSGGNTSVLLTICLKGLAARYLQHSEYGCGTIGIIGRCKCAGGADRLDEFKRVVDLPTLKATGGAISFKGFSSGELWIALATFLYVDFLDTTGTLFSMASFINNYVPGVLSALPLQTHILGGLAFHDFTPESVHHALTYTLRELGGLRACSDTQVVNALSMPKQERLLEMADRGASSDAGST